PCPLERHARPTPFPYTTLFRSLITAALLVVFGMSAVVFSTTVNTSLQMIVPDNYRGRAMSMYFLLLAGSTPLGGYLTGLLAEHRSEEHTSELQSRENRVYRLLL